MALNLPTPGGDAGTWGSKLNQALQDIEMGKVSAYAGAGINTHQVLRSEARRGKGGVVGTNGKPVVSFRIDHGIDQWLTDFWPLFKARGIPASVGVVTDAMENAADPYEPTTTTWATLLAEHRKGFEIWSHSATHRDPAITGNTLDYEIAGSKAELETQGFKVIGWQEPGISPVTTPDYSNNFDGVTSWQSEVGQRYLANYGLIEVTDDLGGAFRALPTFDNYGLGHYTLDSLSIATAQSLVDEAIDRQLSIQFMVHPRFVMAGTVTFTLANMTTLLDYVKTRWDDGRIEVLTSSGLSFADPNTARRLDTITDGGFENTTTIPSGAPARGWGYAGGTGTGITVPTDGGHTGSRYVKIPATASFTYVYQGNSQIKNMRLQGQTMIAEGWARCTLADTEARLTVLDGTDTTRLNYENYRMLTAGAGWQRFRVPFSIPLATTNVQVRVGRRSGTGDIDWDDVSIRPV